MKKEKRSFKFFNDWTISSEFKSIVGKAWSSHCYGNPMFILCRKLKLVKNHLRTWAAEKYGDGTKQSTILKIRYKQAQEFMMNNPQDPVAVV